VLLAASTHAGEELSLAQVYVQLRQEQPQLALLVVPRHFERGPAVLAELQGLGCRTACRSQPATGTCDILIIDTTGELKAWQELADLVVIGKSFLAEGGQNPAEALLVGKPVICGPHMENFLPLMELLRSVQGIHEVEDFPELAQMLAQWMKESVSFVASAQRGKGALMQHAGATQRSAAAILQHGG
jgi:3-deoxy-D-manno-octulosonic-acid transferase